MKGALLAATEKGDVKTVRALLKQGVDVNSADEDKETALYKACCTPHLSIVRTLINAGADVNLGDKRGVTPLMVACLYHHKGIVEELLLCGADIKRVSEFGGALSHAVGSNAKVVIVKLLIRKGADVNERASIYENETPLFCACRCGQFKIVKMLVEAGANINAINDLDNTPLQEVVDVYEDKPNNLRNIYPKIIVYLLSHGAKKGRECI